MADICNLCRRLANRERLNLLRKVMMSPERDGLSAAHLADMTWLKPATARLHLRVLADECGLVEPVRDGRYISFRTRREPECAALRRLVPALVAFFRTEGRGGCDVNGHKASAPAFAKLLLPLSCPFRIHVLRAVRDEGPLAEEALRRQCGLSVADAKRHLRILSESGLVAANDGAFSFAEPTDSLSRLLVSIALDATCAATLEVGAPFGGLKSPRPDML